MPGRQKKKVGRVVNFYLSDEVLDLIEQYKGNLSRSNFIEEAVKYYISHLADNPKEDGGKQKIINEKAIPQQKRAGGREVMRGTADPVYSGSNPDLPSTWK